MNFIILPGGSKNIILLFYRLEYILKVEMKKKVIL